MATSRTTSQSAGVTALSRAEIMKKLGDEGVDTVDKLVDKLLTFQRSNPPRRPNQEPLLGSMLASPETRPKGLKPLIHQPPQVPLYVDGEAIDPKDITRFDGRPLEFMVVDTAGAKSELHASTGTPISDLMKILHTSALLNGAAQPALGRLIAPSNQAGPGPGPYNYGQVQMFQDIEYGNNWFWCAAGQKLPDLRQIPRGCTLWMCGDWNDQISSTAATESWVAYYWDIWYGGSVFWQRPLQPIPDFRPYGWNDQISSVWDTGLPY
jgi:hypothetical protein